MVMTMMMMMMNDEVVASEPGFDADEDDDEVLSQASDVELIMPEPDQDSERFAKLLAGFLLVVFFGLIGLKFVDEQVGPSSQQRGTKLGIVNHYEVLGVARTASLNEINTAYRQLAIKYHPDKCKQSECKDQYLRIKQSVSLLRDRSKRQELDFLLPPSWSELGPLVGTVGGVIIGILYFCGPNQAKATSRLEDDNTTTMTEQEKRERKEMKRRRYFRAQKRQTAALKIQDWWGKSTLGTSYRERVELEQAALNKANDGPAEKELSMVQFIIRLVLMSLAIQLVKSFAMSRLNFNFPLFGNSRE